jgi:hypothetical protein|tara:strand:- start:217 stop:1035 length:819 start_codon:yes stop_codon:yes gene_type:complete
MTKPKIFIGKAGTGKTFNARAEAGGPYVEFYADNIYIDDVYSFPKDTAIIIEDVHHKADKDKILDLIYAKRKVILTSKNKKDVPKSIMSVCQVKLCGKRNYHQMMMNGLSPNRDTIITMEDNIWSMANAYIRMKDRREYLRGLEILTPPPMQLLSWVAKNHQSERLTFVASTMHRWPKEYFYALLAFSFDGGYKTIQPPSRKTNNPFPAICAKLGLRTDDAYLVKMLVKNEGYAKWAATKLEESECKKLGIKKEKRQPSKRKATRTTLEDFL